ncbi:Other 1 protein kinase [Mycena sanguinolenta]|uniref:Other 1 protein kinase n=1 Tax=Mycena sanguinolenta TaxID=230812 RepID=A0A8H7CEP9_9AGAR|nr:Other 1 protein kinase [Mycena sanguinolenta]
MPTTPTKAGPGAPVQSTPYNRGSGSQQNHAIQHTQEDYASYLQEDLSFEKRISVDEFLKSILHVKNPGDTSLYDALQNSSSRDREFFKTALDNYWKNASCENDLYAPFVTLANFCLGKNADIQFCRDDPQIIRGSPAQRKPDVVSVMLAALSLGTRTSADNLQDRGPPENDAFHWLEIISFWEFKFERLDAAADTATRSKSASKSRRASSKDISAPSSRQASGSGQRLKATTTGSAGRDSNGIKRSSGSVSGSAAKKHKPSEDPRRQCASYALELLTYGGLRSHVIGALITNNNMELLYYDRSIIIRSDPFDFTDDTVRFVNLLAAVKGLTKVQWGYHPLLDPPNVTRIIDNGILPDPFRRCSIDLGDGHSLKLEDTIFQSHGLIGRGTCVSRATMDPGGNAVIVKWSWPAYTRKSEAAFIAEATAKATGDDSWVCNHLPQLLNSQEHKFDAGTPQLELRKLFPNYELRELRVEVLEELFPITALTSAEDLGQAFYGIFLCYRWLYETVGIMHRDVSLNNLMFRKIGEKVYGVLNDFDLAVYWEDLSQSTSKQRTGTKPYMARDLLVLDDPPAHVYRFDLESLFYVMVFAVYHYHDKKEIDNPPYKFWEDLGTEALLKEKKAFFATELLEPTENFGSLKPLIKGIYDLFGVFFAKRLWAPEIREQMQTVGEVNFDEVQKIFKAHLPPPF